MYARFTYGIQRGEPLHRCARGHAVVFVRGLDLETARVPAGSTSSIRESHLMSRSHLEAYQELPTRGLLDVLGIEVLELTPERVVATMPVDERTRQPFGVLHGGASVALAETVVSLGAWAIVRDSGRQAFGLEINANHLRPKTEGRVRATATPVHLGRTTQVWGV